MITPIRQTETRTSDGAPRSNETACGDGGDGKAVTLPRSVGETLEAIEKGSLAADLTESSQTAPYRLPETPRGEPVAECLTRVCRTRDIVPVTTWRRNGVEGWLFRTRNLELIFISQSELTGS